MKNLFTSMRKSFLKLINKKHSKEIPCASCNTLCRDKLACQRFKNWAHGVEE